MPARRAAAPRDMRTRPAPKHKPTSPPPRFQFNLRSLLLLFVVLGSSLAVFGAWGIVVFGLSVGLAIYLNRTRSFAASGTSCLSVSDSADDIDLVGLALALSASDHQPCSRRPATGLPNLRIVAALAVWLLSVGMLLIGAVRGRKRLSVPTANALAR